MNLLKAFLELLRGVEENKGEMRQAAQISTSGSRLVQGAARKQLSQSNKVKARAEECLRKQEIDSIEAAQQVFGIGRGQAE